MERGVGGCFTEVRLSRGKAPRALKNKKKSYIMSDKRSEPRTSNTH